MDDWNHYRLLLAVIRAGSLTRAASDLRVSVATVSRRLAAAEEAFGTVLIERGPSGFKVTDTARSMVAALGDAEVALARATQLSRAGAASGVVRIATMPALGAEFVVPMLPELHRRHPEISVRLMLHYQVVNLGRGDADIAIRTQRPRQKNLVAKRLGGGAVLAFAHRDLVEQHGANVSAYPWVTWPADLPIEEVSWMTTHAPDARIVAIIDDMHAQARAAEHGLGAVLLSAGMANHYTDLVAIPGAPNIEASNLWLAAPEAARFLPAVDAVWTFIVECCESVFHGGAAVDRRPNPPVD